MEEYYEDEKLKFKGEYLNGKRWNGVVYDPYGYEGFIIKYGKGKGKDYNNYGRLTFEGEYLNGLKNGKGKEYYNYGILIFEGVYLLKRKRI